MFLANLLREELYVSAAPLDVNLIEFMAFVTAPYRQNCVSGVPTNVRNTESCNLFLTEIPFKKCARTLVLLPIGQLWWIVIV